MKNILKTMNTISETCFKACAHDFTTRLVIKTEVRTLNCHLFTRRVKMLMSGIIGILVYSNLLKLLTVFQNSD